MPTSVRLDRNSEQLLIRLARKAGRTKSAVLREAIEEKASKELRKPKGYRPYDAIAHLVGSVKGGPPDLSERTGEKVRRILQEKAARWHDPR